MTRPAWSDTLRPLTAFCDALGIASEDLEANERLSELLLVREGVDPGLVAVLTADQRNAPLEVYGTALRCVLMHDDELIVDISTHVDQPTVEGQRDLILSCDSLRLDLRIDKERLLDSWLGESSDRRFIYFFPSAFDRFLTSTLPDLETRLWGATGLDKSVIILPSREIWLDGHFLGVFGGSRLDTWQPGAPADSPIDDAPVRMYADCQTLVKWQETWLRHLTPLHLKTTCEAGSEDVISTRMLMHQVNLALLYTAERTFRREAGWVSVYHGASRSVEVPWLVGDPKLSAAARDSLPALFRFLEWTYREAWVEDRLPIVQNVVSEALQGVEPEQRCIALLERAADLDHNARWHWQALIEKKVESYMTQVRALEDYVASRVQAFGDQVTAIVKSLVDTTLAAVAAVLAASIAALTKEKFDPTVFSIIMVVYATYAAIFPLGFNMTEHYKKFKFLSRDFDHHTKRFAARLGAERVKEVLGNRQSECASRFKAWFAWTFVAYVVLITASLGAAGLANIGILVIPTQPGATQQASQEASQPAFASPSAQPVAIPTMDVIPEQPSDLSRGQPDQRENETTTCRGLAAAP